MIEEKMQKCMIPAYGSRRTFSWPMPSRTALRTRIGISRRMPGVGCPIAQSVAWRPKP